MTKNQKTKAKKSGKHDSIVLIDFVNPLSFDGGIRLEPQAVKAAHHVALDSSNCTAAANLTDKRTALGYMARFLKADVTPAG